MLKAITDFSAYPGDSLSPVMQSIHDGMAAAHVTYDDPPVPMIDFQASIGTYGQALTKKASGAYVDTIAFNMARVDIEDKAGDLGSYVNTVAKGDPLKLAASNFPTFDTVHPPDYSAPAAPDSVVVRQGDVSGSAVLRYRPSRNPSMNEVQTCTGDPTVETNWKAIGVFSGGKATLTGIVPGTLIWIRVRTYGLKNIAGDYSDPIKIMVT